MSKREVAAWLLVITLSFATAWQFAAASRQEGRAEEAEKRAVQSSRHAEQVHFESNELVIEAANHLEQKEHEIRQLQARVRAKLTERQIAQTAPQNAPTPQLEPILAPNESITVPTPTPPPAACELIGENIGQYPVAACTVKGLEELQGVVPWPAAVDVLQLTAQLEFTQTKLQATENELTVTKSALADSRQAMQQWKKAAKRSRLRRVWGVIQKPIIFVAGIALGRASR